jgi:hypothetical protein
MMLMVTFARFTAAKNKPAAESDKEINTVTVQDKDIDYNPANEADVDYVGAVGNPKFCPTNKITLLPILAEATLMKNVSGKKPRRMRQIKKRNQTLMTR